MEDGSQPRIGYFDVDLCKGTNPGFFFSLSVHYVNNDFSGDNTYILINSIFRK